MIPGGAIRLPISMGIALAGTFIVSSKSGEGIEVLVVRNFRLLCGLLVLLMLLAACGDDGDSAGSVAEQTPSPAQVETTADASPTSAPISTATNPPATATPKSEPPATATLDGIATATSEPSDSPSYGWLSAWDAKWERLGEMGLGPDGQLYVDDYVRKVVIVFGSDGSEVTTFEYPSGLPENIAARNDLAIGPDGHIFLLEQAGTTRVQVFQPNGTLVNEWGGMVGFEPESLFDARTIAVGPDGHVFTTRPGGLLQKFTSEGTFVAAWDRAGDDLFPVEVFDMQIADDALYVAASGFRGEHTAILKFDLDGNLIAEPIVVGEPDAEDRITPTSLAIGPGGNLYIADVVTRAIIVLAPAGDELTRWSLDATDQRFPWVEIAVDDAGRVYVADEANKLITVYATETGNSPNGPRQESTLAIAPDRAPCGTPVDVIGKGFVPGQSVALTEAPVDGIATWEEDAVADSDGAFTIEVAPIAGATCEEPIGLTGQATTIEARIDGEVVATTPFTVYSRDALAGLQLSSHEAGCNESIIVTGTNFEPGTNAIVTIADQGSNQPSFPSQLIPVNDGGTFEVVMDVSKVDQCASEPLNEPKAFIIWASTDRPKEGSTPSNYPSQRASFTLLPKQ